MPTAGSPRLGASASTPVHIGGNTRGETLAFVGSLRGGTTGASTSPTSPPKGAAAGAGAVRAAPPLAGIRGRLPPTSAAVCAAVAAAAEAMGGSTPADDAGGDESRALALVLAGGVSVSVNADGDGYREGNGGAVVPAGPDPLAHAQAVPPPTLLSRPGTAARSGAAAELWKARSSGAVAIALPEAAGNSQQPHPYSRRPASGASASARLMPRPASGAARGLLRYELGNFVTDSKQLEIGEAVRVLNDLKETFRAGGGAGTLTRPGSAAHNPLPLPSIRPTSAAAGGHQLALPPPGGLDASGASHLDTPVSGELAVRPAATPVSRPMSGGSGVLVRCNPLDLSLTPSGMALARDEIPAKLPARFRADAVAAAAAVVAQQGGPGPLPGGRIEQRIQRRAERRQRSAAAGRRLPEGHLLSSIIGCDLTTPAVDETHDMPDHVRLRQLEYRTTIERIMRGESLDDDARSPSDSDDDDSRPLSHVPLSQLAEPPQNLAAARKTISGLVAEITTLHKRFNDKYRAMNVRFQESLTENTDLLRAATEAKEERAVMEQRVGEKTSEVEALRSLQEGEKRQLHAIANKMQSMLDASDAKCDKLAEKLYQADLEKSDLKDQVKLLTVELKNKKKLIDESEKLRNAKLKEAKDKNTALEAELAGVKAEMQRAIKREAEVIVEKRLRRLQGKIQHLHRTLASTENAMMGVVEETEVERANRDDLSLSMVGCLPPGSPSAGKKRSVANLLRRGSVANMSGGRGGGSGGAGANTGGFTALDFSQITIALPEIGDPANGGKALPREHPIRRAMQNLTDGYAEAWNDLLARFDQFWYWWKVAPAGKQPAKAFDDFKSGVHGILKQMLLLSQRGRVRFVQKLNTSMKSLLQLIAPGATGAVASPSRIPAERARIDRAPAPGSPRGALRSPPSSPRAAVLAPDDGGGGSPTSTTARAGSARDRPASRDFGSIAANVVSTRNMLRRGTTGPLDTHRQSMRAGSIRPGAEDKLASSGALAHPDASYRSGRLRSVTPDAVAAVAAARAKSMRRQSAAAPSSAAAKPVFRGVLGDGGGGAGSGAGTDVTGSLLDVGDRGYVVQGTPVAAVLEATAAPSSPRAVLRASVSMRSVASEDSTTVGGGGSLHGSLLHQPHRAPTLARTPSTMLAAHPSPRRTVGFTSEDTDAITQPQSHPPSSLRASGHARGGATSPLQLPMRRVSDAEHEADREGSDTVSSCFSDYLHHAPSPEDGGGNVDA